MNVRIARDGVEIGECDWEDLEQLVNEGQVLLADHYWYEGMPDWRRLEDLVGFEESENEPAPHLPDYVAWDSGESVAGQPAIRHRSIAAVVIGCALAAVAIFAFYLILIFHVNRPEVPVSTAAQSQDFGGTDTILRAKATTDLMSKLDKLPAVASPPLYTFYSNLSVAIPSPPAPLTARIRGLESAIDPATRRITLQTDFVIKASFQEGRWFFKHYEATVNDLVLQNVMEIKKGNRSTVTPAIVSLLGLKVKSD